MVLNQGYTIFHSYELRDFPNQCTDLLQNYNFLNWLGSKFKVGNRAKASNLIGLLRRFFKTRSCDSRLQAIRYFTTPQWRTNHFCKHRKEYYKGLASIFLTSKDNSSHSNRCETFKFETLFWQAGIRQEIYTPSSFLKKILSVKRFFINDHGNHIAVITVNLNFFSYKLAFCESTVGITVENCLFL